ncbi:MAG: carbohydrate ABC transporter permease [Spirochaetia bacterium]|jgi:trehalose/maltose transport system permease protein|nr:carbohydrate ABC transporter permease [Spirochaetia bacterium]
MKSKSKTIGHIAFWILVIVMFFYLVFPFYWTIVTSLKTESQLMMTPATFIPRDPVTHEAKASLINYKAVFSNATFLRGIKNSAIVSISVTLICLVVGAFVAFALGKLRFKGKTFSLYLILSMTMFPQISVLTGLYSVINRLHIDAIPAMILSYMLFTLPFTIWVMTSFFKGIPDSLLQAANVDGATNFQAFYMILLPLTVPAMVTTGLLAFIAAWNEYLFALTFTSIESSARTVPVAMALFSGTVARQEPFGEIMAASVVVTIPLLVLIYIFQKRLVEGLTAGAVKG